MINLAKFLRVAIPPDPSDSNWLEGAVAAVSYVVENSKSDEIILYANPGQAWIYSALAKLENVTPPDFDDLYRCHRAADAQWVIEHTWGGGEDDKMYLAAPLDGPGCNSLKDGEQLVFRRYFAVSIKVRRERSFHSLSCKHSDFTGSRNNQLTAGWTRTAMLSR